MEIIGKRLLRQGPKFDVAIHTLRADSGASFEREFIDHPGAVVLVPVLDDGRVVMLENYRHALDRVMWELPAGTVERGEPFDRTAARELAEETGYRAGRLERWMEFYPCPGASSELMVLYHATQLAPGETDREVDEDMVLRIITLDEALAMIGAGRITDGKTIIGLWRLAQHRSTAVSKGTAH